MRRSLYMPLRIVSLRCAVMFHVAMLLWIASSSVSLQAQATSVYSPNPGQNRLAVPSSSLPANLEADPLANSDEQIQNQSYDVQAESGVAYGTATAPNAGTKQIAIDGVSLSAEEVLSILQEQPDLFVEIKTLIAEMVPKQGDLLQEGAITDESLYQMIASSAEVRANITDFLRARGYLFSGRSDDGRGIVDSGSTYESQSYSNRSMHAGEPGSRFDVRPGQQQSVNADTATVKNSQSRDHDRPIQASSQDQSTHDEIPNVLHRPTPYNLLALRDLYTQLPEPSGHLNRFGANVFLQRDAQPGNRLDPDAHGTPLDVPAGPDYVVGPGDGLAIDMWGGVSQSLVRVIDREGRIVLPDTGSIAVTGLALETVRGLIADALKRQFRNVEVAVSISHLRSIRVYVVGDVQRPGAYDISSLSTSLNALYAAGGPTAIGSLRMLRHYRGKQLVGEIDLYDFLLHGVQQEDRLRSGDTVLVPPAGPQVAVYGAVKRPAIYELKGSSSLASILEDAGGTTVSAELRRIVVERIGENEKRETVSLELSANGDKASAQAVIAGFSVRDGDRILVAPILPYSQRVIYLDGHVARPGRKAYRDGMRLSDVLQSYQDVLPEPAEKAEIVRLVAPDMHPQAISFDLPDLLIGNGDITLQPLDTIRIHGRYESDAPKVTVGGEVLRPGTYSLSIGMTAAMLVKMAGGFKRDALLESADLNSYQISNGSRVVGQRQSIRIGDAVLRDDKAADALLKAGDVLTVHQMTGWNDIGSSIRIEGEVAHPGSYGIQQGEHLSSILRRAGGLRETSYTGGAVLLREEVRRLEEKSREELIRQIETNTAAARIRPDLASGDQAATQQIIAQQQEQVLAKLKTQPASGRMVIHISSDIASWENTQDDIEVRAGDVLRIPKRPGFVLVNGQVYNASAITFAPEKTAGWYLRRAGGPTEIANTKEIFIIRANGSVVGRGSHAWLSHDVLSTRLDPGDVVVVPQKIIGASLFWRNLLTVGQITSSIAITAAVAGLL